MADAKPKQNIVLSNQHLKKEKENKFLSPDR